MPATRDPSQKPTFLFTNLHTLYRQGKEAAHAAPSAPAPDASGRVIKAGDLADPKFSVTEHRPSEFIGKRIQKPAALASIAPRLVPAREEHKEKATISAKSLMPQPNPLLRSLEQQLKQLDDLHQRLQFMLKELETLSDTSDSD